MAIGFNISVLGIGKAQRYISSALKEVKRKAEEGVNKATFYAEGEIKTSIAQGKNAPRAVDTGELLNSVKGESKGMKGQISSNAKHAPHVEFGTSRMQSRPHFRNTMTKEHDRISEFIQNKVSEVKR